MIKRTSSLSDHPRARAVLAGLAYFAIVFTAGFSLGALRVLWIMPRTGALIAVVLELPIMVAVSWGAAAALIRWFRVTPGAADRLMMGGVGFALLLVAETVLGLWGAAGLSRINLQRGAAPPDSLGSPGKWSSH